MKETYINVIGTYCTSHCQALIVKTMPEESENVLNDVIETYNFIKANALESRLLTELCKENDSKIESLLLHSNVKLRSKGKVF